MAQPTPSFPLPNNTPTKTPEYNNKSPQPKFTESAYTQRIYQQQSSYHPIETHHIYHSPLRSAQFSLSNSTPLRYLSPAKDSENTQYLIGRPSSHDNETYFLRSENEKLRLVLREKQEELNSFVLKCSHLEKHIKDPTFVIKLEENELRLQAVIRENMRLHEELTQKNEEIQSWKNSFTRIDATMNEKIMDFETTNNELRSELEGWKQKVADLEKKLEMKDEMFNKFLNENKEERAEKTKQGGVKNQQGLSEEQYGELIEKMSVLIKENENLSTLLEQKMEELDRMRNTLDQTTYELEQMKSKYKQLNFSYEELQRKEWDDENKISKLTFELENLNSLLKNKFAVIEDWKAKYLKLGQLTEKVKEFKDKIYYLTDDNVKLNSLVKSKTLEVETLRETSHRLEIQVTNERTTLEELKIKHLKSQNLEESLAIKNQKLEFENQMAIYRNESERLNDIVKTLQMENSKMEFFKSENLKLTRNLDELSNEMTNLRNQYMENHKLIQKNQEQQAMIVVFLAEIEGLRGRIREKEEEVISLKNKIYGKN